VQTPGGFVRVADIAECDATQEVVYDIDVEPGHRISVDVDGTEVVFADFAELPYTHAVYQQEAAALLGALNAEALGQDSLAV
jgi:hypothetical protein